MIVVKVGGSLLKYSKPLLAVLKGHDVIIVPGGGTFANIVRKIDANYSLSDKAAHKMAILAMDQYGIFLSDISGIPTSPTLTAKTPFILLPSRLLEEKDPFEPSWDVTSDTIACQIAKTAGAKGFIILTDVDGIFIEKKLVEAISAKELMKYGETCVDKALPRYLMEYGMDCWVVNGRKTDRVKGALRGDFKGTLITHI